MRHVFVETNWVVAYAAPAHHKVYAATEILKRANQGEIKLYLPSICIAEARRPIFEKFQVRLEADRIRRFLLWAKQNGVVDPQADNTVRTVLDKMEARVRDELEKVDDVFLDLHQQKGFGNFQSKSGDVRVLHGIVLPQIEFDSL